MVPVDTVQLTINIAPTRLGQWRAAAQAAGMTIEDWLKVSVMLAERLDLVGGAQRLPSISEGLDPLVERAVREAAQGQPWESRALLLLDGFARSQKERDFSVNRPSRSRDGIQRLLHEIGLPSDRFAMSSPYAWFGEVPLTWLQAALVLVIHRATVDGAARIATVELVAAVECSPGRAKGGIRELIHRRLLTRTSTGKWNKIFEFRLAPELSAALEAGDVRAMSAAERTAMNARERVRAELRPSHRMDPDLSYANRVVPKDHPLRVAMVRKVAEERRQLRRRG